MTRVPVPTCYLRRRGFTLVEIIVVVTIIAIMAGIALPRLGGTRRRVFEHTMDDISDLLLMYAQRDRLGSKPVGIMRFFHPENLEGRRHQLALVVQEEDPYGGGIIAEWLIDRNVRPVSLPSFINPAEISLTLDGESVDGIDRPLTHIPGEDRPEIIIALQSIDGEHQARIFLSPYDIIPRRLDRGGAPFLRMPVDLDTAGLSREDW